MIKRLILCFLGIITLFSCENNESNNYKLKDGMHRAYVECQDTIINGQNEFAAHVQVKDGLIKKIIFQNDTDIENFYIWETTDANSQVVSARSKPTYYVYIIPDR